MGPLQKKCIFYLIREKQNKNKKRGELILGKEVHKFDQLVRPEKEYEGMFGSETGPFKPKQGSLKEREKHHMGMGKN